MTKSKIYKIFDNCCWWMLLILSKRAEQLFMLHTFREPRNGIYTRTPHAASLRLRTAEKLGISPLNLGYCLTEF